MIIAIIFLVLLFLLISKMTGVVLSFWLHRQRQDYTLMGFFVYFCLFQFVALPVTLMQKSLTTVCVIWAGVILIICIAFAILCMTKRVSIKVMLNSSLPKSLFYTENTNSMIPFLCMVGFILVEIVVSCLISFTGWDTAYYIPNVVKSVVTDTMYVYEGNSGLKESTMNIRYAISSFFTHDAVLAKITGIKAALICRYFNAILCHVISALLVFAIGKELFKKKEHVCYFVCFWVAGNLAVSTSYFANNFLIYRAYEAKAFCANIVLPMVLYIFIKMYKNPDENMIWVDLFIVNLSAMAISASTLLLVPVLNGCLMAGHIVMEKRWKDIPKCIICLLPNMCYLFIYLLFVKGLFVITIK